MEAIPTIFVFKGDEKVRINAVDLAAWKSQGWSDTKSDSKSDEGDKGKKSKG